MATAEAEYESDPEELNRSLATRRREASDDDSDDAESDRDVENKRAEIDSDLSDEQIGTVKYDNDEDGEDSFEEEEEESGGFDDDKRSSMMKEAGDMNGDEEKEKEKQQVAVPTGGAFYMHDDRFQEMSAGGNRRMRGGRRQWGSGEERKWGHDKFEEMNTGDKHYDRMSRGRFRGRGRGRGQGRGYARGSSSNTLASNGQQIYVPKAVSRGRGPRKSETPLRNENLANSEQSKQLRNSNASQNSREKMAHRSPTAPAKTENQGVHAKKNVAASSLSSASPPFYPSVPSSNVVHGIQVGMERLHMNESDTPSGKKYRNTKSGFSSVWTAKALQSSSQGRGAPAAGNMFYPQSHSQDDRFSSQMQLNGDSKGTGQSFIRPSAQGFDQHSAVVRSLSSSPQKTSLSRNQYPPSEVESASKTGALIAKGKETIRPSGSGSFMYSGSQMMGRPETLASADNSNFHTFLPVMQFGGQHGGVPTLGMAYPGYVQSENGVRNPEMTWMPVLNGPGALGASYSPLYAANQANKPGLPSSLPSSAGSSSKDNNSTNTLNDLVKPMEMPEVAENGVSQRQSNNPSKQPRRYSEMTFSK
ncbi:Btz domain [Arabidopsis suecica]|uniref:Btz domain n=1 Tax=Arabidopsis suecica TaxID=45249 RepID=A0A8T2CHP4_ARASU|nr:Btz domain [Arabidopsis suecica]KAG7597123.1 Btz domain [Arabidopsis suecica]